MTKVLVVDDVEDNIVLLSFELEDDGFEVVSASNGLDCLELSTESLPDIILLDIRMPGIDGIETLKRLKISERTCKIPVVMVSASNEDESVVKALDLGAHDFVSKPIVYSVLSARMRSALRLVQAKKELEKVNQELERLASQDPLTDVYNRRHFYSLSEAEFAKANRHNHPLSILMIDVDMFKMVNDTYGHPAGDQALRSLSECCREAKRSSDVLGRIGGEEFALTCPNTNLEGALNLAERIRQGCEKQVIRSNGSSFCITLSIGVTEYSDSDTHLDQTLQRADHLLYEAKKQGRNCSVAALVSP